MQICETLDKIIKPQIRSKYNDWQNYAKPIDILGLECINKIYRSKGTKKIKVNQLPFQNREITSMKSTFMGEAKVPLHPFTTTYKYFHGSQSQPKQTGSCIFQFKTLSEMKLVKPLTLMTIAFIDNWLLLKDARQYQQAVLNCLRSLNSKLHLSQPYSTQTKTSYDWKNDWKLSKPIRMDKAGEDLHTYKPNLLAIQKQQKKKQLHKQKMKQLQNSQFAKQLKIFKDFKIN